jgi:hypothetical protein
LTPIHRKAVASGMLPRLFVACALLLAAAGTTTPAPPPRRPPRPPEKPPTESSDLDHLLGELGKRAQAYQTIALRFICIETIRSTDDPEKERRYDYMYVEAEEQRYKPYRQKHMGPRARGIPETDLDLGFPDSYSWTLMFAPARQHLFRFKYIGQEWFSLRLSHVLEFTAPLPFTSGRTIYEWSGRIWVDAENFNTLKVEAEPGNQAERVKQELRTYRQATRLLGMPLARKPRGSRYNITFLNEFQRVSLPDQAEFRQYTLDLEGKEEWAGRLTLRYAAYQFFDVEAKDLLK